jgi:putative membrane protein
MTIKTILCCAVLSCAALVIPGRANAQSDDDKKFLATVVQANQDEIAVSEVAEKKATDPSVKAFAEKMVKEHRGIGNDMKPFVEQWGIMQPSGADKDHQKEIDKLNGLSGHDFDKEYIDSMVSDHAKALDAFTKEAKDTKDMKFRAVVLKDKTRVAAHKNMAYDLKKKL